MQESVKYVYMEFGTSESSKSIAIDVPFVPTKYQVLSVTSRFTNYQSTSAVIVNADFVNGPIGAGVTDQHSHFPIIKLQNWNNGLHNFWLSDFTGASFAASATNKVDVLIAFYP